MASLGDNSASLPEISRVYRSFFAPRKSPPTSFPAGPSKSKLCVYNIQYTAIYTQISMYASQNTPTQPCLAIAAFVWAFVPGSWLSSAQTSNSRSLLTCGLRRVPPSSRLFVSCPLFFPFASFLRSNHFSPTRPLPHSTLPLPQHNSSSSNGTTGSGSSS